MSLNGVDVSGFQPSNIFNIIPADFGLVKATEGSSYVSGECNAQVQSLISAGKPFGVYHFADGGDANTEADHFVNNVKGYIGKGLLVLDLEAGALNRGAGWAKAVLDRIKSTTGVTPILYASRGNVCNGNYAVVAQAGYPLWVAAYPSPEPSGYGNHTPGSVAPWGSAVIYQYTSAGRIGSYSGNLDLDIAYLTKDQWAELAKIGGRAVTPTLPSDGGITSSSDNITSRSTVLVQKALINKGFNVGSTGADGIYGPATKAAVAAYQKSVGISADGIYGPVTDAKLFPTTVTVTSPGVAAPPFPLPAGSYFGPKSGPAQSVSGYFSHSNDLKVWQQRMKDRGWAIGVDGLYGPETESVTRSFQSEKHITVDGLIGPTTWAAAWTSAVTA